MRKDEGFRHAQEIWASAISNSGYLEWRENAVKNYGMYDGTGQWTAADLQALLERGQSPITINILQGLVDSLSGIETQSRYRIAARVDSNAENDHQLSRALSHFLYQFQEENDSPYKDSLKFRDTLISGIGWSCLYEEDGVLKYDYVSPFDIIPDFEDNTPQFTDSRYVCRKWFVSKAKALSLWPQLKDIIDNSFSASNSGKEELIFADNSGMYGGKLLVSEVQFKVARKAYRGQSKEGYIFSTFDLDVLKKFSVEKSGKDTFPSEQIMRCVFFQGELLEYAPLNPNIPFQKDFSYIPLVWKKRVVDNVPFGFIDPINAIQVDLNARFANALYSLQAKQIIIEGDLPQGMSIPRLKQELKSKTSVVHVPQGTRVNVNSSIPLGEEQLRVVRQYLDLVQRVSGVQDEMLGIETNATSGLAQKIRQTNSVRTNIFAFDSIAYMKKRVADLTLKMFQHMYEENIYLSIFDEEEKESLILNLSFEDSEGNNILENNVNFLPFSLYMEEVPNFRSSLEEQKEDFIALMGNPNAPLLLQSPTLLTKVLQLRGGSVIAKEIAEAQTNRMRQEQQLQGVN